MFYANAEKMALAIGKIFEDNESLKDEALTLVLNALGYPLQILFSMEELQHIAKTDLDIDDEEVESDMIMEMLEEIEEDIQEKCGDVIREKVIEWADDAYEDFLRKF